MAMATRSKFRQATSGNLSLVFAMAIIPMVICIGSVLDYSTAVTYRTTINSAADSAILAGVRTANTQIKAGNQNWQKAALASAQAVFNRNLQPQSALTPGTLDVAFTRNGPSVSATGKYLTYYHTSVMKLFGVPNIPLQDTVSAQSSLPNYLDVHLVIDGSASMGIGATLADQQTMFAATGCAIACHYKNPWTDGNYDEARATGAVFRIDYVREAVKQFINKLQAQKTSAGQIRISVDMFQNELYPLVAPTTDLVSAAAATSGIDLISYPKNNGTNITYSLQQLAAKLAAPGDGSNPDSRTSFVILLTDGIEDSAYGDMDATGRITNFYQDPNMVWTSPSDEFNYFQTVQTIAPSTCDALKNAGHKVMTASIQYLVPPMNLIDAGSQGHFQYIGDTLNGMAETNLAKCASSGTMAFNATDSAEIAPMFDNVISLIQSETKLRLTQ